MELNNKKLSTISFLVLILFACNQVSSEKNANKETINAAMFQNTDTWDKSEFPNTSAAKKIKLTFLNNPYKFAHVLYVLNTIT